jgi:hypothetical protein
MAAGAFPPSVHVATLYEKTSARGLKYFVGRWGLARLTLLPGETAEDGTPTWRVLLQEASAKPQTAEATNTPTKRPRRTGHRSLYSAPQRSGLVSSSVMADDQVDDLWPAP